MVKKLKKHIGQIAGVSMLGAGTSLGITALGGNSTPIQSATRFLPLTGTVAGAGGVIRAVNAIQPKRKRTRRR